MQITDSFKTNTQYSTSNKPVEIKPNLAQKPDVVSFTGKEEKPKGFFNTIVDLIQKPFKIREERIARQKAEAEAKAKAEAEAAEQARIKRQKYEEEQRIAAEKRKEQARIAAEKRAQHQQDLESFKKKVINTPEEELLNLRKQCVQNYENMRTDAHYDYIEAFDDAIASQGKVYFNDKIVKEYSLEAYNPTVYPQMADFDVVDGKIVTSDLSNHKAPKPGTPNIAPAPKSGEYSLKNISYSTYNLLYHRMGEEGSFSNGFLEERPIFGTMPKFGQTDEHTTNRSWRVKRRLFANCDKQNILHYATTIDFKLENRDRSPAFKFNIEGDLSNIDVENIKKILIEKGHMKNLFEAGDYKNIVEAMQDIVDYMNKISKIL